MSLDKPALAQIAESDLSEAILPAVLQFETASQTWPRRH